MTQEEALWYLSQLFGMYLLGWGTAFIIHSLKTFSEKI